MAKKRKELAGLSPAQHRVLADLERGGDGWAGVEGRSMYGAMEQVLRSLRDRGLIEMPGDKLQLTAAGQAALEQASGPTRRRGKQ